MMKRIRKPAVAGSFYPSDPGVLRTTVVTLLAEARGWHGAAPLALVAPHAGYVYSGPVAASAYACLKPFRERYRRVVLLGPAHRAAVRGIALPDVDAFASPLGDVALDRETMDALDGPDVMVDDAAHRLEHSLEVHLPFLQTVLDDFQLVPIVVGVCPARDVEAVINALWGGDETVIIVSSDLSHFHAYADAREIDARGLPDQVQIPVAGGLDGLVDQVRRENLLQLRRYCRPRELIPPLHKREAKINGNRPVCSPPRADRTGHIVPLLTKTRDLGHRRGGTHQTGDIRVEERGLIEDHDPVPGIQLNDGDARAFVAQLTIGLGQTVVQTPFEQCSNT